MRSPLAPTRSPGAQSPNEYPSRDFTLNSGFFSATLTFWMGKKVGEAGLDRWVPRRRLTRIRKRIREQGAIALAVLDLIPPPFPFTPFSLLLLFGGGGRWTKETERSREQLARHTFDDSDDVRCFKLVDGKVTFVHRCAWPALVRLARDGALPTDRVASFVQEHMPTGEHRNVVTPFPDWVDGPTAQAAGALSTAEAKRVLGDWLTAGKPRKR